ncbi:MAG: gliding motility-associated-like protein, partial [Saprospiraceae bacterium]
WDFGDGSTSSEFSPGHLYDTAGTFEVNLIVESEILGCTDTVDHEVIIYPLPTVEMVDDTICGEQFVTLNASISDSTGVYTYSWFPAEELDNPNIANPMVNITEITSFEVFITDENTCVGSDVGFIQIFNPPAALFWDTIILDNTQAVLPFLYEPNIYNYSPWSPIDGLTCEDCSNPTTVPLTETTTYTITFTDIYGCREVEFTYNVTVLGEIDFPNAFTPNGDGTSEYFNFVPEEGTAEFVDILEFKIYNRWGKLVYDNDNPGTGWDGNYKDEPAISDVYIYVFNYEILGIAYPTAKGDLTLIR